LKRKEKGRRRESKMKKRKSRRYLLLRGDELRVGSDADEKADPIGIVEEEIIGEKLKEQATQ